MRQTKAELIKRNAELCDQIGQLEKESRIEISEHEQTRRSSAQDDRDRRSKLAHILRQDEHGRFVDSQRAHLGSSYDPGRVQDMTWEEIFFIIGGLHATSEYSLMAEENRRLQRELDTLKAKLASK